MKCDLHGVIPAMLTPFTEDGKLVDLQRACDIAAHLAEQGVHGIFVGGTTGEGLLMSIDERKSLLEAILSTVGDKVKVVAHTGCLDTPHTIALTEHAAHAGAHSAAVVAPGFYRYDEAALKAHFRAVASATPDFPVLLYNLPGASKNPLSAGLVIELAETVDNIVGIKDSGGRMQLLNAILARRPEGFVVINGVDEYTLQALATGADGSVASTANVVPEIFIDLYNQVRNNDRQAAWETQKRLGNACALFQYGAMVAFYKEALRLRGVDAGFVRPPQRELTADEKKHLERGMKLAGMI